MQVLQDKNRLLLIFGAGLIGGRVVELLEAKMMKTFYPFAWQPGDQQNSDARKLERLMLGESREIHIVWSAGKALFSCTSEEIVPEFESFKRVLALCDGLNRVHFHLFSSAGGLFEGQTCVGRDNQPNPLRPYGQLKFDQENCLQMKNQPGLIKHVYRPSSVYGYLRPGKRRGLIGNLIFNGVRNHVSSITGELTTLRDYVFVDDVARQFIKNLESQASTTEFHIAGKPSSIYEICAQVKTCLGRPLYYSFRNTQSNAAPMSYRPSLAPTGWNCVDLGNGIRSVYLDFLKQKDVF